MNTLPKEPTTAEELYKKISTLEKDKEDFRKAWITGIEQMQECSDDDL